MPVRFVLVLLLLWLAACAAADADMNQLSVEQHIDSVILNTEALHKLAEALLQRHHLARSIVVDSAFPLNSFTLDLTRNVKNAEQRAVALATNVALFKTELDVDNPVPTKVFENIKEGRVMYARIELTELRDTIRQSVFPHAYKLKHDAESLADQIMYEYTPANNLERQVSDHGSMLEWIVIVGVVVLPTFAMWRSIKRGNHLQPTLVFLVGIVVAAGAISSVRLFRSTYGPSPLVLDLRSTLPCHKHTRCVSPWEEAMRLAGSLNETLSWLTDYCMALDLFNETVVHGIVEFSHRVSQIATADGGTDPEVALELVVQTRERIQTQKTNLERLSATRKYKSAGTELERLLSFLQAFELFFSQMEISIYANLRAGLEMNRFFSDNLDILVHHIRDGRLGMCLHVLTELYRQQDGQLAKLRQANQFVTATNDAITKVRLESTRIQPSLQSDEMTAWIKKMAAQTSVVSGLLPALAPLLAPAGGIVIPVAVAGVAIAGMGYNWQGYYQQAEADARDVITELIALDKVLQRTETGLTAHETTLTVLMEEIKSVMQNVNKSEARFQHIRIHQSFGESEIAMLTKGVSRVKESVELLSKRYQQAMDRLFTSIVHTANALPKSSADDGNNNNK